MWCGEGGVLRADAVNLRHFCVRTQHIHVYIQQHPIDSQTFCAIERGASFGPK